jgi:hypothetical protein
VSDFCYSWPVFERVFRQAELMDRMMDQVGVVPAVAARVDQGMAWYTARTACIDCLAEQHCRKWLENAGPKPAPEFCPNVPFFRRCARLNVWSRLAAGNRQAPVELAALDCAKPWLEPRSLDIVPRR